MRKIFARSCSVFVTVQAARSEWICGWMERTIWPVLCVAHPDVAADVHIYALAGPSLLSGLDRCRNEYNKGSRSLFISIGLDTSHHL
jgi:hypothetical protein